MPINPIKTKAELGWSKIANITKLNNNGTLSSGKSFLLENLSTKNPEKNKVATVSIE